MTLQAFLNSSEIQRKFMRQVQNHYDADEIIHGVYWENGKGCAIGCMTHSDQHIDLELLYGIPEWLGRLIDTLFEGMSNEDAKVFVLDFAKTVSKPSFLGFDNWQHIYHQSCSHVLEKECKNIDYPLVKQPICDIITLHKTEETDKKKWSIAATAAAAAAESAIWFAAWFAKSAAWFATESAATTATWSAESAAATATTTATWSAESAATAAAAAAESAIAATTAAAESTRSAVYKSIANNLIEILQAES